MRAFAYLRVSKVSQELSPEAQRAQLEAYCAMKGYELVYVFEETGVSGSVEFSQRPVGSWLMALVGEVDAVLFAKLDRAFRDTVDCIMTADELHALGKSVHFLDLSIDTSTATGELCMTMLAGFARFERRRIADRITEALAVVKSQGRKIGPAGFGFRNRARIVDGRKVDGGLHESNAGEAAAVSLMLGWHRDGYSLREIVGALNDGKVPTRRGGKWHPHTVSKILARIEA